MKRILLFSVIIFSLFTWRGNAQLVETFDTGIPATWATYKLLNGALSIAPNVPSWEVNTQATYNCSDSNYGTPPSKVIVRGQTILAGNTSQSWLVTEQVTVPANGELEFVSRTTSNTTSASDTRFKIKISTTSQTDFTSFTSTLIDYDQIQITGGANFNFCFKHILNLSAFANQNIYIAFIKEDTQVGAVHTNNGWVLDDVKVLPKCFLPTNAQATSQTTSANLTWTGSAPNYEISLLPGSGIPENGTIYTATTNSLSLSDLTSSTVYMYYIRAICEFNTSAWAGPFVFSTLQTPFVLDSEYFENFESPSYGFSFLNGTQPNKWAVGTATHNGGTKSMYISNNDGVSNIYSTINSSVTQSYRDIQMPATVSQIYFSFDWKANGENNQDYMRVWLVPSTFVPTPGQQITSGGGRVQIGNNFGNNTSWENYTHTMNGASWSNQVMRLVFEWRNNAAGGGQPPAAVDNLNIQLINCPAPSMPTTGTITASEATLNWNAPTGAIVPSSYDYYFSTTTVAPTGTTTPVGNVLDTTVTLDNLSPSTTYYFWVRSNCGATGKGLWIGPRMFNSAQMPAPLDYSENFEAVNPGWTFNNGTQTNKWIIGTATQNGGAKSMYISNDNGVTNAYTTNIASVTQAYRDIQMPVSAGEMYFSFDWKANGENAQDYMRVWIVPATFTPTPGTQITAGGGRLQLGTNFGGQSTWQNFGLVMNALPAWQNQTIRLVFEWRNNANVGTQPPAAVDNIIVQLITCSTPSMPTIGSLTENEVTFNWNAPGGTVPTSYDYYFTTIPGAPNDTTVPTSNVPGTTATINNLVPSTTYYFWVRSNCGSDGTSLWVGPVSFNTPQIPTPLDYYENFEGANPGWTLNNGTQANKWVVGTATSNSPTHSLYISNDNGATNAYNGSSASVVQAYKDLMIPATAGQVYVSFDWKGTGEGSADYMRAWLVPVTFTPTPGAAITAGGGRVQLGANFNQQSTWKTEDFVLNVPAAWSGQIMRLVFEWRNDANTANQPPAAVDNVNFSVITCPAPSNPTLVSVATNTATTAWTGTSASYDYYYSTTNTAPEPTTTPSGNAATNQANLTGLTDATVYYFWVRSNCDVDGVSFWVGPLIFNTAQIPTSLDYFEDFEGANPGWTLNNGTQTNKWVVGTATSNSPTHSLYISDNNGTSNNYNGNSASVVQAYKDLMIPATAGQIYISFDWKAQGEGTADYLRAWMVPVTYTPTPGTQITAGGGRVQLGTNFNQQNTWQTEDIVLNVPAAWAGQIMRLVFEWRNNTSVANQSPAAVDNINVSVITCQAPSNPTLSAVTINSATTAWTGTSASYDYYYSTTNTPPVSTTTPSGSTATTQANLTGLDDSTTYYFWVRSDCGVDGVSFWVGPLVINTPQVPAPLPYYENFDGASSGYTFNNGTQSNKWVVGGATFNSPSQSLYISNDNGATNSYGGTTSVTQAYRDIQMPTGPLGQMLVSFDWKNTGESTFDYMRVWIVPVTFTPTPGTQITAGAGRMQIGANYNQQASWQTVNQVLNVPATWAGQPIRLVFEWRNDGSVFNQPPAAVDNVNISLITCQAPTNLAITTVTVDSATFTWNAPAGSTPTSYDYYISTTNVSPSPTDTPTGNTTDTTVTVEGLDHSTQYFFWVRSNCGTDDGTSFWIGPVNFNTPQIPAEMNFNDDFEGQIKWTFNNGTQENKWVVGTATSNSPTHSLYISNNNGTTNSYAGSASVVQAYRDIQMPAVVNEVAFSFDWKGTGEGSFDYMRVWLVPTTFTPVPGTQITAGAGRVQIGANYNQQATWKNEFFILQAAQYQGQIVRVVFEWRNDGSLFNQPPAAVDNVVFHALTCPSPTDLMASTTQGSSQVELTWTPVGTETQWEIIIQISGTGTPLPGATGIIVNEPSYTFLASDDELYEFYVRPICSEDDIGLWSAPGNFSIFTPPGCASIDVVGVGVEIVDGVIFVCPGESTEVNLNASFFGIAATTSYEVESIDYAPPFPFVGGEVLDVTTDDVYSPIVNLPFNFCFFGESYSKAKVGSNGVVTFGNEEMSGGGHCAWSFNQQLPNTGFPIKNSIFGVYQDTHPTTTSGIINYQVLGTYPCRALVVNFYELPQFSCGTNVGLQTSQIVVYEISNIIEVYIGNRTPCGSWNGGNGLVGILNNTGNQAYTPPGRNTGAWTATNEAWRFTPNGAANVDFQWLLEDEFLSDQQDLTISLTPEQIAELEANGSYTLTITAQATYETCSNDDPPVTTSKDIDITFVYSHPDNEPVDLTSCSAIPPVTFDLTYNDAVMLEGADNPDLYSVHYYNSQADAESGDTTLAILNPENYEGYDGEIIWVRVSDIANCSTGIVKFFTLHHGTVGNVTVDFEYDSTIYCIGGNNPVFIPSEDFATGGLFSVTPAGLTINPVTGSINLAATGTLPGNYTITYEIVPNECTAGGTATFNIEVKDLSAPDLDFSYADACVISEVNPTPIITNITSGGVFSSTTLSVDPLTGEIDLSAGVTAGVHEITYTLGINPTTCTDAGTTTATITLFESMVPVTDFNFGMATFCYSDEDVSPEKATDFFEGGVFSATSGLSINPTTGVVDVQASSPGVYTVTYTVDQDINTCNEGGSSTAQITIIGEFAIAVTDECRGNNYWLLANPIEGSFAPATATYVWTIDGIEVGYDSELDVTGYLNGSDIPQGGINVSVAVNDGCDSYGSFLVTSTICMIQKGISPNGDTDNNSFDLTGMGVKELKIFNRYGMEVYSKSNYVNEWTGLDNKGNELPDGTYFYVIQKNNGEKLSGWVYINRKY